MAGEYPGFRSLGVEVIAISTDDVGDALQMAVHTNAPFPVLADPHGNVTREYGVFDLLGDGVAAPAVFIVDRDREIQLQQIGKDIADRPDAGELLGMVKEALESS